MLLEERIFARNKADWLKLCDNNYYSVKTPQVQTINNGIVLPVYVKQGVYTSAGGVCDKNFNFVAGLSRSAGKYVRWGDVTSSYKVDKGSLFYRDEVVVFGGVLIAQFGHMLLDNLSRLWWHVCNLKDNHKYVFIVTCGKKASWFNDFFRLLDLPEDRVEIIEHPTQFKEIIIPEEAGHSWADYTDYWLLPYNYIRNNALQACKEDNLPNKLYLTKRFYKTGGADTINEEYFEKFYKEKGFVVVAPETMPVAKQIAFAASADEIATTLGTTSHFILFSKNGVKIDLLTRVDNDTLLPQCLINQAKKSDYRIVDVSLNFLYCERTTGVCLIGITNFWKEYVKQYYGITVKDENASQIFYQYLVAWTEHFYSNPQRFNQLHLSDLDFFDVFVRLCNILLNKTPDRGKYNLSESKISLIKKAKGNLK